MDERYSLGDELETLRTALDCAEMRLKIATFDLGRVEALYLEALEAAELATAVVVSARLAMLEENLTWHQREPI